MKTIKNDENCTIRKMLYKEESLHEKKFKKLTTESEKKKKTTTLFPQIFNSGLKPFGRHKTSEAPSLTLMVSFCYSGVYFAMKV